MIAERVGKKVMGEEGLSRRVVSDGNVAALKFRPSPAVVYLAHCGRVAVTRPEPHTDGMEMEAMNNNESYTPPAAVEAPPSERRNWCYWQNGRDLVRVIWGWPELRRIPHPGLVTDELVEALNTEIGVSPDVAFEIVGSSMRAENQLRRPKHSPRCGL